MAVRGKERELDVAKSASTTSRGRAVAESSRAAPSTHADMEVETAVPASKSRVAAIAVAVVASIAAVGALLWPRPPSVSTDAAAAKDALRRVASVVARAGPCASSGRAGRRGVVDRGRRRCAERGCRGERRSDARGATVSSQRTRGPRARARRSPRSPAAPPSPDSLLDTR